MYRSFRKIAGGTPFKIILSLFVVLSSGVVGFSSTATTHAQAGYIVGDCSSGPSKPAWEGHPTAQWVHPAPGIWLYIAPRREYEHYHIDGLAGYVWSLDNVWRPKLFDLQAALDSGLEGPDPDPASKFYFLSAWLPNEIARIQGIITDIEHMIQEAQAIGVTPQTACDGPDATGSAYAWVSTSIRDGSLTGQGAAYTPDDKWWNEAEVRWDLYASPRDDKGRRTYVGGGGDPTTQFFLRMYAQRRGTSYGACYGQAGATAVYGSGHMWEKEYDTDYSEDGNCE